MSATLRTATIADYKKLVDEASKSKDAARALVRDTATVLRAHGLEPSADAVEFLQWLGATIHAEIKQVHSGVKDPNGWSSGET